ncbi:MAG: hypothetical protein ACRDP4_01940 [Nocardioidaceae bacterium]
MTTRERGFPHHIAVVDDGGLNRTSWAMCEAVRAVSTQRWSAHQHGNRRDAHEDHEPAGAMAG